VVEGATKALTRAKLLLNARERRNASGIKDNDKDIAQLVELVAELTKEIEQLKELLSALTNRTSSLESTVSNLGSRVSAIESISSGHELRISKNETDIATLFDSIGSVEGPKRCIVVERSASQDIAPQSPETVQFTTQLSQGPDESPTWTISDPGVITITHPGMYLITANVSWEAFSGSGTDGASMWLNVNGDGRFVSNSALLEGLGVYDQTTSGTIQLDIGDEISLRVYHNYTGYYRRISENSPTTLTALWVC
jgi:uncharacterized phage infection (PIP) family protein YhgE